jgi:hypothetical protein
LRIQKLKSPTCDIRLAIFKNKKANIFAQNGSFLLKAKKHFYLGDKIPESYDFGREEKQL